MNTQPSDLESDALPLRHQALTSLQSQLDMTSFQCGHFATGFAVASPDRLRISCSFSIVGCSVGLVTWKQLNVNRSCLGLEGKWKKLVAMISRIMMLYGESCTNVNGDVKTLRSLWEMVKRKAANCIKYVWPVWGSNPRHSRY